MNALVSAKMVSCIMKDHCSTLEAIVRHIGHSQVISPPYLFKTISKNTDTQVSLDVIQFYLAVIYYFKASLNDTNADWLERVSYDLNYASYHNDLKLQQGDITHKMYHDAVIHAYEKAIFKYIRLAGSDADDNEQVTLAVLTMTDNTAEQLGYTEKFARLDEHVIGPYSKRIHKRLEHYSTLRPASPPVVEVSSTVLPTTAIVEGDDVVVV